MDKSRESGYRKAKTEGASDDWSRISSSALASDGEDFAAARKKISDRKKAQDAANSSGGPVTDFLKKVFRK